MQRYKETATAKRRGASAPNSEESTVTLLPGQQIRLRARSSGLCALLLPTGTRQDARAISRERKSVRVHAIATSRTAVVDPPALCPAARCAHHPECQASALYSPCEPRPAPCSAGSTTRPQLARSPRLGTGCAGRALLTFPRLDGVLLWSPGEFRLAADQRGTPHIVNVPARMPVGDEVGPRLWLDQAAEAHGRDVAFEHLGMLCGRAAGLGVGVDVDAHDVDALLGQLLRRSERQLHLPQQPRLECGHGVQALLEARVEVPPRVTDGDDAHDDGKRNALSAHCGIATNVDLSGGTQRGWRSEGSSEQLRP
eukprot:scaffold5910_cov103-Isochrysis_galbana.AAC.7